MSIGDERLRAWALAALALAHRMGNLHSISRALHSWRLRDPELYPRQSRWPKATFHRCWLSVRPAHVCDAYLTDENDSGGNPLLGLIAASLA
jgi:hypothetical protein